MQIECGQKGFQGGQPDQPGYERDDQDFDKSLLRDIERLKKAMGKKDAKVSNLNKRMERLDRKFEDELERFDFKSVYSKKKDIPGYG